MDRDVFLDETKVHTLGDHGESYRVRGPLSVSRSAQGQPVVFQAGESEAGFTKGASYEAAVEYYRSPTSRALAHGRRADDLLV